MVLNNNECALCNNRVDVLNYIPRLDCLICDVCRAEIKKEASVRI